MANDLTGDYDVVAAFSLGAVNRILAAMHRGNRLPHSLSMAVDDFPDFRLGMTAVSIVDTHGNAIADAGRVKAAAYASVVANGKLSEEVIRNVDPVVNWRPNPAPLQETRTMDLPLQPADRIGRTDVVAGIRPSEDFSYLSGVAQLQLGPPTMQLPRDRTDRADIYTPAMIRYIADNHTLPLSSFMRGQIVTTFGVKQTASPAGTNIVVDVAGPAGNVHFNPAWSANSLDANDRAAIDKALSKSVKNSFQPSTTPFPHGVKKLNFKGFPMQGAVAVMMNVTTDNNPSLNSVGNVSLRTEDHFTLAVNGDSITQPFAAAVNASISPRVQNTDVKVVIDYWIGTKTFHIYTNVYVLDASVVLIDVPNPAGIPGTGQILLTIPVQVRFGWENKPDVVPNPVDFDFTVVQAFTLTLNGRKVGLQRVGPVAINIPNNVPDAEKNPARDNATQLFNNSWSDDPKSSIQMQINQALSGLSADGLQGLLTSLMNPKAPKTPAVKTVFGAPAPSGSSPEEVDPDLEYTYFEIKPAGIILHGTLTVPPWSTPRVEFDKDPWAAVSKPEYRALNSWIPGGTIQEYQWNFQGAGTVNDTNRFVTVVAPAITQASNRICLTFSGSRITASGPVFYETVHSARTCKWTSFPVMKFTGMDFSAANRPNTVVPKPGPSPEQKLEALGHASPWAPDGLAGGTANFIVHFPDNRSAGQLEILPRALAESGRSDTETAILCVLTPEQLSSVRAVEGLMYADDTAAWERLMGIRGRPATVVLNPSGEVVWRQEGEVGGGGLAEALRAHLSPGGQFFPQFVELPLRIGQLSPNFVFEFAPSEQLTLRKLAGRPLALLFWRSSSAPSIAAIRTLHRAFTQPGVDAPLIVAINDGEDGEFARGLAAGEEGAVVVVPDPARQIARAYGVSLWPTIVFLDVDGLVQDIRFGLISEQELDTSVQSRPARSILPGKES